MSFRVTFILLVLLTVVGGYVLIFELHRQPKKEPEPPFFYDVETEDIARVSITFQGQHQIFVLKDGVWRFEETGEPVDMNKWSGMTLLLSGPRASRVLQQASKSLKEYGLDPPEGVFGVTLKSGQAIGILLGYKTADETSDYAQVVGVLGVLLVSSAWGDVITKLVTEPPVITPTPEGGAGGP